MPLHSIFYSLTWADSVGVFQSSNLNWYGILSYTPSKCIIGLKYILSDPNLVLFKHRRLPYRKKGKFCHSIVYPTFYATMFLQLMQNIFFPTASTQYKNLRRQNYSSIIAYPSVTNSTPEPGLHPISKYCLQRSQEIL
ncbi:hypothetical protein PHYBLDRAFT_166834 [Phycomyces blakesleeanus NRRL 1555(-)]|uniref:Uncharacterized protein n=1 Tax=Phycomyces blakesleeanus (strain ATCC 8743b / DSM 1359 / FGSC 10004 / NBRC 33097 / NRRL 1555) TaxID=763407 RepID=A0A162UIZ9_PHYB8|nr:hypothetical protein PHYBLDRAFT_166834 [Phycomyces blakesleeanus NRRL 1555(-)]OAD75603.1 hypothetical protein PHYBLDRAFT_166834 [Phycomyces blakesleeanus NRRL 1555(-)]|eukprot:XP_018293643.1 hypothetical protein PHYBLDRAFT_166834 [Phycomyces blakesleeanus NRRL 1555(-)]